jgi:Zn-dependent protease
MQFAASDIVAIIVAILFSMGLHEAMHAFASHWLGDPTAKDLGRLTLNPLKHIDIYMSLLLPVGLIVLGLPPIFAAKPVPFNPMRVKYDEFGAALIGLAGPFTNLILATAAAGILRIIDLPTGLTNFGLIFIMVNIAFFVFNMLPIPPLDGSRLLYAVAPEPLQKVMYQIETMGFMFLIILLVLLIPIIGPVIVYLNESILDILLSGTGLV